MTVQVSQEMQTVRGWQAVAVHHCMVEWECIGMLSVDPAGFSRSRLFAGRWHMLLQRYRPGLLNASCGPFMPGYRHVSGESR